MYNEIKEVTREEADRIINNRNPLGLFRCIDNSKYIGIDNTTGDAWVEEFNTLDDCIKWLKNEENALSSDKVLNNDLIIKANIFKDIIRAEKDQVEPTIQSLLKFKEAYYELLKTWYENDILDQTESLKIYPFHISFDELNVAEWVDSTVEEIQKAYKDIKKEEI